MRTPATDRNGNGWLYTNYVLCALSVVLLLLWRVLFLFLFFTGFHLNNTLFHSRCVIELILLTSSHCSELHVSGLSRGSNHYNSIHAKNMDLDWVECTMLTTQSSLLVGTIATSTSLSLKYKFAGIGMTENWHHTTCIALTEQSRIAIQKELLHIKHCEHRLYI